MTSPDPREPEEPPIRFTDNRKLRREGAGDPSGPGAADVPITSTAPAGEPDADVTDVADEPTVAASLLDERTADLQRLQAEYANYRKRADRDRLQAGDAAVARVLTDLLPVLDDLERAEQHGDLAGPLKAVADKLEGVTTRFGLTAFGALGDPFDPSRHEAVLHDESSEVTVPTCTTVMRPGYTAGDRLLRPAMVGVSDPATPGKGQSATTEERVAQGGSTAHGEDAGSTATALNDEPEGDRPPVS